MVVIVPGCGSGPTECEFLRHYVSCTINFKDIRCISQFMSSWLLGKLFFSISMTSFKLCCIDFIQRITREVSEIKIGIYAQYVDDVKVSNVSPGT